VQDKHSRAASALTNDVGKRIGRILSIRPETSDKCLDCHALNVRENQRARSFDSSEGVSCESCHGPASDWLGPHTTKGWAHQRSVELGMTDVRNPVKRSETCLSCHLGSANKWVDHEMIAAGHPDLYFELDSFSAAMPKHWNERDKDPWFNVRLLATGQAVQLREDMRRITRATGRFWPEYSELDCFACHHNLTESKNSWRQERGYSGRRPGNPPWNASRYAVLKSILEEVDGDAASRLDGEVTRVSQLVVDVTADPKQVGAAARQAGEVADQIVAKMSSYRFDAQTDLRLMKKITASGDWISNQGERAAEQAAMALNSMVITYFQNAGQGSPARAQTEAAVAALFKLVASPSTYVPRLFSAQLREIHKLLSTQ
jgi:hypothetical protein